MEREGVNIRRLRRRVKSGTIFLRMLLLLREEDKQTGNQKKRSRKTTLPLYLARK